MDSRLYKDKIPHVKNSFRSGNYLYTTNCSELEAGLCRMEMNSLFGIVQTRKDFFTQVYADPSRSPFIKHCISILHTAPSIEGLKEKISEGGLQAEKFKVYYINIEGEIPGFREQRLLEREAGKSIAGEAEMHEPATVFGITKKDGQLIFGYCESNDYHWQKHKIKPYSYSNSLSVEVSRALVNIAVPHLGGSRLVDPCCGVGTVLIEAMDQGIDAEGWELNKSIGYNAKGNLEHFGFKDVVSIADMNTIQKHFDAAVLDLPYGVFTSIKRSEQLALIGHTRKIADRVVIVTFEDMSGIIAGSGFRIEDTCTVAKGKFVRHVYLCS